MTPMSKQNSRPEQGELLPHADTGASPAALTMPAARPAQARPGRRPLWARLLGRLIEPWLGLKTEPEQLQHDPAQPVVYVLEDYGLSNALILDKACRDAGLPSPLVPLPGNLTGR